VSVFLFQFVDGFEIPVKVVSDIIPRIASVVDILVRPCVREDNFARVRSQVGKCIKDVAEWNVSLKM